MGRVVHIEEKSSSCDGFIHIDFQGVHITSLIPKNNFDGISVLSPDHVFVSESDRISLVSEEALLEKRAQQKEVVKMLVALTSKASALDVPNAEGRTVLMSTAMYGLGRVVQLLLNASAQPGLKDTDGLTALLLARGKGHTVVVELLNAALKKETIQRGLNNANFVMKCILEEVPITHRPPPTHMVVIMHLHKCSLYKSVYRLTHKNHSLTVSLSLPLSPFLFLSFSLSRFFSCCLPR